MTRHPHHGLLHRLRSLYLWHRYVGLGIAVVVIWLSVTGILLNHTHDLALDKAPVQTDWLLNAYGISTPPARAYKLQDRWVSQIGAQMYLDTLPVGECTSELQQAVFYKGFILIACRQTIVILLPDGTQVDKLPAPAPINKAGINQQHGFVVRTPQGNYRLGNSLLDWQLLTTTPLTALNTIQAQPLPANLYQQLTRAYRGQGLSWERVLRDAHSGRLAGTLGVWLVDAVGIGLILLTITGTVVWIQRRKMQRKREASQL